MLKERHIVSEDAFVELVVWRLQSPVKGSRHRYKYRLAYVVKGQCVLRYDNEQGQRDHKHLGGVKIPYRFSTPEALLADFWKDVENWRP